MPGQDRDLATGRAAAFDRDTVATRGQHDVATWIILRVPRVSLGILLVLTFSPFNRAFWPRSAPRTPARLRGRGAHAVDQHLQTIARPNDMRPERRQTLGLQFAPRHRRCFRGNRHVAKRHDREPGIGEVAAGFLRPVPRREEYTRLTFRTHRVYTLPRDPVLCRSRRRGAVSRSFRPADRGGPATRRAAQAAAVAQRRGLGRSGGTARQSPGSAQGRSNGQHSIRINDQRRIRFVSTKSGPQDVDIVDYHRG